MLGLNRNASVSIAIPMGLSKRGGNEEQVAEGTILASLPLAYRFRWLGNDWFQGVDEARQ